MTARKIQKKLALLVFSIVGGIALVLPVTAPAEEVIAIEELPILCAEIFPCSESGQVVPPFDQGPCSARYAKQCAQLMQSQFSEELSSCHDNISQVTAENTLLKKKYLRTLKKLRRMKSAR